MSDKHTFLGMPGYGRQTAAAGRSLWRASRNMEPIHVAYQNGSLLAQNFNSLWCTALNMQQDGPIDYFAMLHDDIGVEDFWLDSLIEELEAQDLDILGVVSPIKDTRGITSTALHDEGDNWMPSYRLTMHDIYQLPKTFTSDDVERPLLINTGCWVCRFDPEWNTQVHFECNDRIVFNEATGKYMAQNESEDWFFSRLLHELNLRVGVTRKIELGHQGEMFYTNMKSWGTHRIDTDSRPCVASGFPWDVRGWLTPVEGRALSELALDKDVLEIGSFCGRSTICLARTAKSVAAVDYFDGRGTPLPGDTLKDFDENVTRYGVADKVCVQHPERLHLDSSGYDVIFIDGAHDFESVAADIQRYSPSIRPEGILIFHDYASGIDPGVTDAVDELLDAGGTLLETIDSMAVVRLPALVQLEA